MSEVEAWLYDGVTAERQIVRVRIASGALLIEGQPPMPFSDLVARGEGGRAVYGRKDSPGWRLGFDHGLPDGWQAQLPQTARYGAWIDRLGLGPSIIGGLIVTAIVFVLLWQAPGLIAPLVPESWERKLGDTLVGDLGGRACHDPAAEKVLARLAGELSPKGKVIRVRVLDIPMVNAVALPGGQIAIFNGLLTQAKSPDELAGVLGHEIGHVAHRHVVAGLIRQFGFGLVLGSGSAGQYADALLSARYSRDAESEADSYAIDTLTARNISTKASADLFGRFSKAERTGNKQMDVAMSWLSSHPMSVEREQKYRQAARQNPNPVPALSPAEWSTLRKICAGQPKPKDGSMIFPPM